MADVSRGVERPAIRLATPDDCEVLVRLRWKMLVAMGRDEDTATQSTIGLGYARWLRREIEQGTYIGWAAVTAADAIVAMAGLWIIRWQPTLTTPDLVQGYVFNVYTEPEYRRLGLARSMMALVLEECQTRGIKKITLHASEDGKTLYESLGFKQTNEMRLEY